MTEYPVQCFNNNGEPYGRYCNPYSSEINHPVQGLIESRDIGWDEFNQFASANTFPMPGAEIGKTYERDQVEVKYQYLFELSFMSDWIDCDKEWYDAMNRKSFCPTRKIFQPVISKTETTPQPVEKEPETVELLTCRCGTTGIKGEEVFQPFAPYYDTTVCESCWEQFITWQKQQEASR